MKWVYGFSAGQTDGNRQMTGLLGGKGANLAGMSNLGIPVPPGLTVTTQACLDYQKRGAIQQEVVDQIWDALEKIEHLVGKTFGSGENPLLLSVRSGAPVSMPGMMDTVLNLGLNDQSVEGLAKAMGDERFAWDSYRRFIQMYSNVVLGLNISLLESMLEDLKDAKGLKEDTQLSAQDWKNLVRVYKSIVLQETGKSFPEDPKVQLLEAVGAVFRSWNNERAVKYRQINSIDDSYGTAVNIQVMVFGNRDNTSATGVCFTRDPSSGEKKFFGEYLLNAQGEDVVAGTRTPMPINRESQRGEEDQGETLEETMPDCYQELKNYVDSLERHYKDMQDVEFTVEQGKLYILQTRNGKRTAAAGIKIAMDFVGEGVIDFSQAVMRIRPEDLDQLLHPRLDPSASKEYLLKGLPASPGAASGKIALTSEQAVALSEQGEKVILVRRETCPDDIAGMAASEGILTARGGMTSHAAVVARGMGTPCVAGCAGIMIDLNARTVMMNSKSFKEGDFLTIDGGSGEIFEGYAATIPAEISDEFAEFLSRIGDIPSLGVRANGDNAEDVQTALDFGAQGIGLCRTEHMFFAPERILAVREMIFATSLQEREEAVKKLLPFQRKDFVEIFRVMKDRPVNIRLLDPPLHEFFPHSQEEKAQLAKHLDLEIREIVERGEKLEEFNPMLGHRGCRLGITYPEIYRMQVRAVVEAALAVSKEKKTNISPEIMIPLVSLDKEFEYIKGFVVDEIEQVFCEQNRRINYKIGTMIELPRAAIVADEIARKADFFSFGTNDLTQTTLGISRDDSGRFLSEYTHQGLLTEDPFVSLDQQGVGYLVELATKKGRQSNANIHIGLCGEHGGDPHSIRFCHGLGLDYVSCSPFRVPIARLAAVQAALYEKER